jgi:energy-coupling factor transporter ATP-binding protein EcfA2
LKNIENYPPSVIIKEITFNDGSKQQFKKDDIVLLVGANNVGKSRTLKDIKVDICETDKSRIIIKSIEYEKTNFSQKNLTTFFEKNISKDYYGNYSVWIDEESSYTFDYNSFNNHSYYRQLYKAMFSFLSTENRLAITRPFHTNFASDKQSLNILKRLDQDSLSIKKLNEKLYSGFNKAIDIKEDIFSDGTIIKKYKIGVRKEIDNALDANSRERNEILKRLDDLHSQGDGIRNAVAILSSLIVNEHSLILIDEPETFLHPPQAKVLGKNIVELSEGKQLFISTHNIDFIRGVIEKGSSRVKIIKIDRDGDINRFNLIQNSSITSIANDMNLKYTNILNGLFYESLVLCENESDCKFYSAILEHVYPNVYQKTLFCAVGGKSQYKKIVTLLKELNIKHIIISDIDFINNKNTVKDLMNAINEDSYDLISVQHNEFLNKFQEQTADEIFSQNILKAKINEVFNEDKYMSPDAVQKIKTILKKVNSFKLLKDGGTSIIPQGECISLFNEIKKTLDNNKVFILECGEIERFVPEIVGHGNLWVENTFNKYNDLGGEKYEEARKFIERVFGD